MWSSVYASFTEKRHLLPMGDLARLVARRNVKVTIMTTPLNAIRVRANIDRERKSGSSITFQLFRFPNAEAGLPEGCESLDTLPSTDLLVNFTKALCMLQDPVEQLFEELSPTPTCIIFDKHLPFVADIAKKLKVPRITFDGTNCFTLLCNRSLYKSKVYENVSKSEPFVVPGLPHRIVFKKSQLPELFTVNRGQQLGDLREKIREAEEAACGMIVNSFEELEDEYVKEYRRVTGRKVWCVGPVSISNKDDMDKAQRGNTDSNQEEGHCLKWLDSCPARSVIYVCLGSLNRVTPEQLMELGLGLEATKRPFIWVLRCSYKTEEMEKLLKEDGLEERVKARGLIIRGWMPQVLILSHKAIGSFLTHCGWNSTLEGICSGVPLITYPQFAEQFYNEKVAVQLLEIGVRLGVENAVHFGEEEKYGVQVKKEKVKEAIEKVMGEEDEESERIRERARNFAEKANKAMQKGGSSYLNLSLLIEDICKHNLSHM
ncbi:UDP-glycosyltransferase 73C12-like isoform X2 [Prosopis cineraria]|uniref:UDP-glycosyltransferase 73C12-like isoform X2 n=1 Tax=Prosopis cineraria TaxID=364024 RepID=UPI00240F3E6D|nr:UDP-glycosyltransferase 73C12-like isoform X2 [Prosopis cineraria]